MKIPVSVLVIVAVALGTREGAAQEKPGNAIVKADHIERLADHVVKASGNADVKGDGWSVHADSLEMRVEPRDGAEGQVVEIIAVGNAVLDRGQVRLQAYRLQFAPRSGRGTFEFEKP